jgi:DNA-binding transcriptional LysR family regulator
MRLLSEEPMVFVCRRDHPRSGRRRLHLADLSGEDLVGFPPGFGLRRLMDDAFHAAGVSARTSYEVPAGFAAVADLVGSGPGTAFMPASEAQQFTHLHSVDLIDAVTWKVYLAAPPIDRSTPATARLADILLGAATDARRATTGPKRRPRST